MIREVPSKTCIYILVTIYTHMLPTHIRYIVPSVIAHYKVSSSYQGRQEATSSDSKEYGEVTTIPDTGWHSLLAC